MLLNSSPPFINSPPSVFHHSELRLLGLLHFVLDLAHTTVFFWATGEGLIGLHRRVMACFSNSQDQFSSSFWYCLHFQPAACLPILPYSDSAFAFDFYEEITTISFDSP